MIKFKTEKVKTYSKMIMSLLDSDDLYSENCYLNFSNNSVEFKSGITKEGQEIFGSVTVPFEGSHSNFWVDATLFLHLCNSYDELEIDNKIFKNGDLVFELKNMEEDDTFVSFDDFSWEKSKTLTFQTIASLIESSQFSGERFPFVSHGKVDELQIVAGSDGVCYYENVVDNQIDIQFSKTMIRLLSDSSSKEVKFDHSEGKVYFNINNEVQLITNIIDDECVPCDDLGFRGLLNSAVPVASFKKSDLQNAIKFLKPFFAKSPKQVFSIVLKPTSLEIKPDVADNKATQNISISYFNENEQVKKFGIMSLYLEKILRGISSEDVVLKLPLVDSPSFGLFSKDTDSSELYMTKFIIMED